jgi:hypothetical protein
VILAYLHVGAVFISVTCQVGDELSYVPMLNFLDSYSRLTMFQPELNDRLLLLRFAFSQLL